MLYSRRTCWALLYIHCKFTVPQIQFFVSICINQSCPAITLNRVSDMSGPEPAALKGKSKTSYCTQNERSLFTFVIRDLYFWVQDAIWTFLLWGLWHDVYSKNCWVPGEYVPVPSSLSHFTDLGERGLWDLGGNRANYHFSRDKRCSDSIC